MFVALLLVALAGPDGQTIYVNPEDVVSVRAPRAEKSEHFGPSVRCILQMVDGRIITIAEDCDAARAKFGAKDGLR